MGGGTYTLQAKNQAVRDSLAEIISRMWARGGGGGGKDWQRMAHALLGALGLASNNHGGEAMGELTGYIVAGRGTH